MQLDLWKKTYRSEANLSLPHTPPPFNEKQKPPAGGKASSSGEIRASWEQAGQPQCCQPEWGAPASGHSIKDSFFSLPSGLTAEHSGLVVLGQEMWDSAL